mgnify:CR=1 FL=1
MPRPRPRLAPRRGDGLRISGSSIGSAQKLTPLSPSADGFRKTRRRKLSAANGQCGWSEFSHAFFVRNRRDLLCQIKRMEHLSTSSSNGEPAEEQPTKRPRLPSVDDVQALSARLAVHDPDPTARQLAVALGGILPTGF